MSGKALVGYMSQTGNTKKVAEAIYQTIPGDKTIADINNVESLEDYDVAFLGFPMIQMGPPARAVSFLREKAVGKRVALFVTHGAGLGLPPFQGWLQKFRDAAEGAELLGLFSCQGEVSQKVRAVMAASDDPQLQMFARMAGLADGQPDEASLEKARAFAREVTEGL